MHKFFTPPEMFCDNKAIIQGEDVKHIYKVLRLEKGEKIILNNQCGEEFLGEIIDIAKDKVTVNLLEKLEVNNESNLDIYLFQALPKASKMDIIVQKNTELGVKSIIPVITSRVDVKLKGEFKKIDRLQRIALEACKQCKRTFITNIEEPIDFKELLHRLKTMDLIIVPYENAENYGVRALVNSLGEKKVKAVAIIIGPEGGFEEEEIQTLSKEGAHIVTLGPRILRTETAGFVSTSIIQYELGDLGGRI